MPATRPTFTATFERAANRHWVVALVEEPNVHGYGDTLVEARSNIRIAITTLFGPFEAEEDGFELVEDVRLPEAILAMVTRAHVERALAKQRREESRAAEEAVAVAIDEALTATRQAAALVAEHGELMGAVADASRLADDVRLPELVLQAVERAHRAREAARGQAAAAQAAQEAANGATSEAIVTNREAARMLTMQCGLSRVEAAGLLGLSSERVQRLLTG
ncbi:MAG: type II toxin-antitoxin system HicB family antitoxin [Acidimicrobiales bacterium]